MHAFETPHAFPLKLRSCMYMPEALLGTQRAVSETRCERCGVPHRGRLERRCNCACRSSSLLRFDTELFVLALLRIFKNLHEGTSYLVSLITVDISTNTVEREPHRKPSASSRNRAQWKCQRTRRGEASGRVILWRIYPILSREATQKARGSSVHFRGSSEFSEHRH